MYEAQDLGSGREYALKVTKGDLTATVSGGLAPVFPPSPCPAALTRSRWRSRSCGGHGACCRGDGDGTVSRCAAGPSDSGV